jgi:hypothetical protein
MLGERLGIALGTKLLQELGRALHVGEEEGAVPDGRSRRIPMMRADNVHVTRWRVVAMAATVAPPKRKTPANARAR